MSNARICALLTAFVSIFVGNGAGAQEGNSPELEFLKTLEGRWEGTSGRNDEVTIVTYSVTGRGTAVIEKLFFPASQIEMTTIYHDDQNGQLVLTHYCSAGNQPYLALVQSSDKQLDFDLSPNDHTIDVENEWHAHGLRTTLNDDGTLIHDWRYWHHGQRDGGRYIQSVKVE